MIEYRKWITRRMLQEEPSSLFVFGDNMLHQGLGGQAREMRGEPNAVGIPTKWIPSMQAHAFFKDQDLFPWLEEVMPAFQRLMRASRAGIKIVWPADGIGTGRARLERSAPAIWNVIEAVRRGLE